MDRQSSVCLLAKMSLEALRTESSERAERE
jgi:hypothetical protein